MNKTICLDPKYSSTRLLVTERPQAADDENSATHVMFFAPFRTGRQGEGGLRTKGYFKKTFPDKPLISVVTVVRNGEKYIENTIQNVLGQDYDNVEYIIIDGASKDKTVNVIRKYEHAIDYWVSEPDGGIYDAMNKGISLSSGEWINFMNAGDIFHGLDTLRTMKKFFLEKGDLLYGDARIAYKDFERVQPANRFSSLWKGMICCHQSVFIRKTILTKYMFNTKYRFAADYDLLCRISQGGHSAIKIDKAVSRVISGGYVDTCRVDASRELKEVSGKFFKDKRLFTYIKYQILVLVISFKKGFSEKTIDFLTHYKYHIRKQSQTDET